MTDTGPDQPARRSDRTRAAILTAARERFAADGYEKATIRSIAADADIDPAMVMRYYGNKEGLFAAAAQLDLRLPDLRALDRPEIGATLAGHLFDRWEHDDALVAMLRAGVTNPEVLDRLREIFASQVGSAVAAVCPDDAPTRAGLVATQALGLALCRYVLKLPPVVALTREAAVTWLGPTFQRYITE
ncbi:TetR/AcrR family transcriptional regulator [Longispora fulva]|uniref:AcrR family transcriptional regulator n=1 Tax=Longispora fulva TaxID=619741 RepID=A0A8J7GXB1_9ACTN|nr:TetR family transcriptional regulator [Longispora fulva]MBG6139681.1 AcrR family transcriptional regulator [Longispora fulva]